MDITQTSSLNKEHKNSLIYLVMFVVGVGCMIVATFFLIEGMSHFAGSAGSHVALIALAILFQVTESLCFISATGFSAHSMLWRGGLFLLGSFLFVGSIFYVVFAQKAAFDAGNQSAEVVDSRAVELTGQIASLDKTIQGYRDNAKTQSASKWKDSREQGRASLDKAVELENEKQALSNELFALRSSRQQAPRDIFSELAPFFAVTAAELEWYVLVGRSILLEFCGIFFMSFGVSKRHMFDKLNYKLMKKSLVRSETVPVVSVPEPVLPGSNPVDLVGSTTVVEEPVSELSRPQANGGGVSGLSVPAVEAGTSGDAAAVVSLPVLVKSIPSRSSKPSLPDKVVSLGTKKESLSEEQVMARQAVVAIDNGQLRVNAKEKWCHLKAMSVIFS